MLFLRFEVLTAVRIALLGCDSRRLESIRRYNPEQRRYILFHQRTTYVIAIL
jgi:hypothetical protein